MQVHRCQFVDYVPQPIEAICFGPEEKKLAVARTNIIEIWDVSDMRIEKTMNTKDPSAYLRSIFWFQDRLLTGGLNGQICEWDLSRLEEKKTHDSMGGPIWNMSLSSGWKFLAIACEDGSVRVFRTKDDDGDDTMDYYRSFAGQPCRVLSVAWHPNEKDLFSGGSDGTIRRFDVFGRNQLSSIKVESIKKDPPMIWSLAVLNDFTIISGDSNGYTQFWNGDNGTQLQGIKSHIGDIFAIHVQKTKEKPPTESSMEVDPAFQKFRYTIYSTGVDSKIAQFNYIEGLKDANFESEEGFQKWVMTNSYRPFAHDQKALTGSSSFLVSGGVGARLAFTRIHDFSAADSNTAKISPFPTFPNTIFSFQSPQIKPKKLKKKKEEEEEETVASEQRSLLLCAVPSFDHPKEDKIRPSKLQLWKLGSAMRDELTHSKFDKLQLSSQPELLMELKTKSTDSNILSCAMSPDCSLISFSCYKSLHLFSIQIEYQGTQESNKNGGKKYNVKLKKLTVPEDVEETSIHVMSFDQTSTKLILADNKSFLVHVLDCSNPSDVQMVTSFATNAVANSDVKNEHCAINMMTISPTNKYLAVSLYNNFVQIFDMKHFKPFATLPVQDSPHSAIAFQPETDHLFVATTSGQVWLYDIVENVFNAWSKKYSPGMQQSLWPKHSPIQGFSFSKNPGTVYLFGTSFIGKMSTTVPPTQKNIQISPKGHYKCIMFSTFVNSNELLLVERPWGKLFDSLPDPVYRDKYAT